MTDLFDHLIHPHVENIYNSDYQDKQPLHIKRGCATYFDQFLTVEDVIGYLGGNNTYPNIQVVRDGQEVAYSRYTKDEDIKGYRFNQVIDTDKLTEVFTQEKSTIRIFQAHRSMEKVAVMCKSLQSLFCCPVQANVYLSPPESCGFGVHFDTHSVFAIQLYGNKKWKVFDSAFPLPLNGEREPPQEFTRRVARAKTIIDCSLETGDTLYIPRGYLHEVCTEGQPSIHLTFGILHRNGYDVLEHLLSNKNSLSLRKALPTSRYQQDSFDSYKQEVLGSISEMLDKQWSQLIFESNSDGNKGRNFESLHNMFKI